MHTQHNKMKATFLLFLLTFCTILSAKKYYVSPSGSDKNQGTLNKPWATWGKAFNTATRPGDTTYFRGGVYYSLSRQGETDGIKGTAQKPVCFFNYPGEKPILDCGKKTTPSEGVVFYHANHVKLRGLTVRNNHQIEYDNQSAHGFYFYLSGHVTIDECVVHDIGFRGFYFFGVDTLFVNNCDAYNIVDSLSSAPGNAGDGFIMSGRDESDTSDYAVFKGCRAWHVSDDGWDIHSNGYIELNNCWAFDCGGYKDFAWGNGIKLNLSVIKPRTMLSRKVVNCLLAYNRGSGLTTNEGKDTYPLPTEVYNNTSAFNGLYDHAGHGFTITSAGGNNAARLRRVFVNNIAYGNKNRDINKVSKAAHYTHSHNSWDIPVSLTNEDFVSLDSTGFSAPRKRDGSLPDFDFMKLKSGSKLIDAGTDVGLSYEGKKPDLGYKEYVKNNQTVESLQITNYSLQEATNTVSIAFYSPQAATIKVKVLNNFEKQVISTNHNSTVGNNNKIDVDLSGLLQGTYTIHLSDESTADSFKITKEDKAEADQMEIIKSFPNPTADLFAIQFYNDSENVVSVNVYDKTGEIVITKNMNAKKGTNKIVLDCSTLKVGIYNIVLDNGISKQSTTVSKINLL